MKTVWRVANIYLETLPASLDLTIIAENYAIDIELNPVETQDLYKIIKTFLKKCIEQKICTVCQKFENTKECIECKNKEKFQPIEL